MLHAQQEFQKSETERQRNAQLFEKRIEALKAYHVASRDGSRKVGLLLESLGARLKYPETLSAEALSTAINDHRDIIEALAKWHGDMASEAIVVNSLFDGKAPAAQFTAKTFHTTSVPITSSDRKMQDPADRVAMAKELSEEITKMKDEMVDLGRKNVAYLDEASTIRGGRSPARAVRNQNPIRALRGKKDSRNSRICT